MSIRERRPGVWQIRAYAGTNEAGRSKYVYRTFFGSKSEARKEEIRLKAAAGALPRGAIVQSMTLGQYFERFMSLYVEPSSAPNTIVSYRSIYKNLLDPQLGQMKLSALTHDICQRAFNEALKYYSRSSVGTAKSILSACLTRARISGLITTNPLADLRLPRYQQKHVRALTPSELKAFVDVALSSKAPMHAPLLAAAALTGMRRGELIQLKWKNVDLAEGIIRVREGGSRPGSTKSASGMRDVAMPEVLKDMLAKRYKVDISRRASDPDWNPQHLVFTSRSGESINSMLNLQSCIKKVMQMSSIDIPGFRLHDLRHSHGSLLVDAGAPITEVAVRLGQVVQTTVRTYLHSSGEGGKKLTGYIDNMTNSVVH